MQWTEPPPLTIDQDKKIRATFVMENGGKFVVELYPREAPRTVNNFVFLAEEGFYDGVMFHRVLPGFMAQTGDPTGTGSGGPGYSFENELHPDLRHDGPGVISMANRGGNATNGSQFFITYTATPNLDGLNPDGSPKDCTTQSCHSVFGKVVSGMEVVENLTPRNPAAGDTFAGDVIKKVTVFVAG